MRAHPLPAASTSGRCEPVRPSGAAGERRFPSPCQPGPFGSTLCLPELGRRLTPVGCCAGRTAARVRVARHALQRPVRKAAAAVRRAALGVAGFERKLGLDAGQTAFRGRPVEASAWVGLPTVRLGLWRRLSRVLQGGPSRQALTADQSAQVTPCWLQRSKRRRCARSTFQHTNGVCEVCEAPSDVLEVACSSAGSGAVQGQRQMVPPEICSGRCA